MLPPRKYKTVDNVYSFFVFYSASRPLIIGAAVVQPLQLNEKLSKTIIYDCYLKIRYNSDFKSVIQEINQKFNYRIKVGVKYA